MSGRGKGPRAHRRRPTECRRSQGRNPGQSERRSPAQGPLQPLPQGTCAKGHTTSGWVLVALSTSATKRMLGLIPLAWFHKAGHATQQFHCCPGGSGRCPRCSCCVRRGRPLADAIAAPGRTRPAAEEGSLEFQKVASQHVFLPWVPGFSADK